MTLPYRRGNSDKGRTAACPKTQDPGSEIWLQRLQMAYRFHSKDLCWLFASCSEQELTHSLPSWNLPFRKPRQWLLQWCWRLWRQGLPRWALASCSHTAPHTCAFCTCGSRSKASGETEETLRHLAVNNLFRPSWVMNQLFRSASCHILVAISKSVSVET